MNKKKGEREKGREQGTPSQRAKEEETTHKPIRGGEKGGGRGTGSPGTSLARKTRCQMGRRTMSQVKGCNAARGNIAK